MNWYIDVLKKYAVFCGRASRKEYWMFTLFSVVICLLLRLIELAIGGEVEEAEILVGIYSLGVVVPSIAVTVRRLHDTGRSGWWVPIGIVPIIGAIVLVVFTVQGSQQGDNQHGPNPKMMETQSKRQEGN